MNKDEMMIKEIAEIIYNRQSQCIVNDCEDCVYAGRNNCSSIRKAGAIYNAGYRKVAEDEFVLKQSEIDELRKDQAEVKFLKDKIKQETAREIISIIIDDDGADLNKIAQKYGIELE